MKGKFGQGIFNLEVNETFKKIKPSVLCIVLPFISFAYCLNIHLYFGAQPI